VDVERTLTDGGYTNTADSTSTNVRLLTEHFREGTTGCTLTVGATTIDASANMTIANCLSACQASGYNLAGAEYSGGCCKTN